jgi:hypothetical protein
MIMGLIGNLKSETVTRPLICHNSTNIQTRGAASDRKPETVILEVIIEAADFCSKAVK